jgi:hypothetical protein
LRFINIDDELMLSNLGLATENTVCTLIAASPANSACRHSMRDAGPCQVGGSKANALYLRPLNQKPNPPHAIPLIRIQPKRDDEAGGQGLCVAEPDGVYGLALVLEL